MFLSKKTKAMALCLALLSCLCVVLPGAAFAAECAEHTYGEGTVKPATMTEDGSIEYVCSVCGAVKTEPIARIESIKLYANNVSFKNKAQMPDVIVMDREGNRIDKEYYTVSITTPNGIWVPFAKAFGIYTVTVTMKGKYSAEKELKFSIAPAKVESLSVSSPAAKTVKISFSPVEHAKGYQIMYSKHKHGPFKKLATVSGTSYSTSKLSSNTKYYFKVRAYKHTYGGTVIGSSSPVRSVTVK